MNNREYELFARSNGVSSHKIDDYRKYINGSYTSPTILEERQLNVASMDVFSRLFLDRILWIRGEVNNDMADIINSQLLFLQTENPESPITVYINSPGGSVYDGMAICDTFELITCPISTTCIGMAASMGSVLLSYGDKGKRSALPHSRIMVHAPSGGATGTAPDIRIAAKEMEKCEEMLYGVLAKNTGKDIDYIKQICDRDCWLNPTEAIELGIIDKILTKNK